jgi:hypothetical protein
MRTVPTVWARTKLPAESRATFKVWGKSEDVAHTYTHKERERDKLGDGFINGHVCSRKISR